MKLGVSSYSLLGAMRKNEMDILGAIQWVADNGGAHIEIVPIDFSLVDNPELTDQIVAKAKEAGIEISNYAIGANFITETREQFEAEIERVKRHVDVVHRLGAKKMRHDIASRPIPDTTPAQFDRDFPSLVEACRAVADYASQFGITTSIENHGYFVQNSERVLRLVHVVDRANFRTTLDVGNFLCVDENPIAAVKKSLPHASMVHFKDFYIRPSYRNPGDGWFPSAHGTYLRGAIVGQGDIDMPEMVRVIKASGYDGYLSLEFEGKEECKWGIVTGLNNIKRLWAEA
ncbi:sugar phosphate isomerase/epimerase family protein [Paenibacillus koleovorans]|uniref:sugar phosphate isomerase/epimerase family protein n=1 Tax=Paenibacillus koleovorans TaxID=121608 RepID=UPI000FD8D60C|nr:sugar phosphate isomerase/epimerase family protein [Paenibacillus koleovorans]